MTLPAEKGARAKSHTDRQVPGPVNVLRSHRAWCVGLCVGPTYRPGPE
jgi:hypothetical protein